MAAMLSDDERQSLVDRYADYARVLAKTIARRCPSHIALDDLIGYGMGGLVEAAGRYDPSRGASFKTFAHYRIRGAIFDGLRKMNWFGRADEGLRFEAKAHEHLADAADGEADRVSEAREASLEESVADLASVFQDLAVVYISTLHGFEPVSHAKDEEANIGRRRLENAITTLPEREQELLRLVYVEDLSIDAAGKQMDLSRSWASRLHGRALKLLRRRLGES